MFAHLTLLLHAAWRRREYAYRGGGKMWYSLKYSPKYLSNAMGVKAWLLVFRQ